MIQATLQSRSNIVGSAITGAALLVEQTYGAKGDFVILTSGKKSVITKDGVSVLRSLYSDDLSENGVLEIIKEASLNTLAIVGDGTTSTILLANEIYKRFKAEDYMNKTNILKNIENNLKKMSVPVSINSKELLQVAETSVAGDSELAGLILDAYHKADEDNLGTVIVEMKVGHKSAVSTYNGIAFSGYLANDSFLHKANGYEVFFDQASVVISDSEIIGEDTVFNLINKCVETEIENLIIIAPGFAVNSLSTMMLNNGHSINIAPVIYNGGSAVGNSLLAEALSTACGQDSILGDSRGIEIGDIDIERCPEIQNFSMNKNSVRFIGNGDSDKCNLLANRYLELQGDATTDEERDMYKILTSIVKQKSVSVILGGDSKSSLVERKDRADDCVNAVSLALAGGVVPGGAVAYRDALKGLQTKTDLYQAGLALFEKCGGNKNKALDPTKVVSTVLKQALELSFLLGKTKAVVMIKQ